MDLTYLPLTAGLIALTFGLGLLRARLTSRSHSQPNRANQREERPQERE